MGCGEYQQQLCQLIVQRHQLTQIEETIHQSRGWYRLPGKMLEELEITEKELAQQFHTTMEAQHIQRSTNLLQRLQFYPFTILEVHAWLSMIFNHLVNLSTDYYIPKLVFYWNFHVSTTVSILYALLRSQPRLKTA